MFTPVEVFLGWRYTRAKRRNHFVSFISAIAMLGVALGIAALITILSIMNGFEGELRDRILSMAAHVVIERENRPLENWRELARYAEAVDGVAASAPFIRREAMLTHFDSVNGAIVRGIEPERETNISVVAQRMLAGDLSALESGSFNVVLGRGLAETLRARIGSKVTLIAPEPVRTPAGMVPRLRRFVVVGIFEAGVHEYDTSMALVHLADAAKMFRVRDGVSGIRIRLEDPFKAPLIGAELMRGISSSAPEGVVVVDWTETNVNLFRALKTEKMVMFIILALTIGVAAFNLVSTLVMVVSEKNAEIAVLQTIGMTKKRILWVFLIHGGLIGAAGILAGVALGIFLANNVQWIVASLEQFFNFKILSPEVYYISEIPSQLETQDVVVAVLVAIGLCLLAPLYPALLASRTAPAQALRYD